VRRKCIKAPKRSKQGLPGTEVFSLLTYTNGNAHQISDIDTGVPILTSRLDRWEVRLAKQTSVKKISLIKEKKLINWNVNCAFRIVELPAKAQPGRHT
jgi:hypothetical protein